MASSAASPLGTLPACSEQQPQLSPQLPRRGPLPPAPAHRPIAALPAARTRRLGAVTNRTGSGWEGLPLSLGSTTPSSPVRGRQEEFGFHKLGASSSFKKEERKLEDRGAKSRKPNTTHKTSSKGKQWKRKQNCSQGLQ